MATIRFLLLKIGCSIILLIRLGFLEKEGQSEEDETDLEYIKNYVIY